MFCSYFYHGILENNGQKQKCLSMAARFVEQLRKELGYTDPCTVSGDGSYIIDVEPDLHVSVMEMPEQWRMRCILAPLPAAHREEFLKSCMVGNLFGRETGGAALGIDELGESVSLNQFLPIGINYRAFRDAFEDFVNYADAWRRETLVFIEV